MEFVSVVCCRCKEQTKIIILIMPIFLLFCARGAYGEVAGPEELHFLEEVPLPGPGPLHVFAPVHVFRGPFFGSIIRSFFSMVAAIIPLHLFTVLTHAIIPDILAIISPLHGVADDVAIDIPTIFLHLIPDFVRLLVSFILIPFRLILLPIYLISVPIRLLINGVWLLYRITSLQPKFLLRIRFWLNKLLRRPIIGKLRNLFSKGRLDLRRLRDLIQPTILPRLRLIGKRVLNAFTRIISRNRSRILNFFNRIRRLLVRILAVRPLRPTRFARLRLAARNLLRPGLFRLIRPVGIVQRLLLRFSG